MSKLRQKQRKDKRKQLRVTKQGNRIACERSFWKKSINTKAGSIPFFDPNYWTKQNPSYIEGVSTQTSKEMMEHFLKWINNYDLEQFKRGSNKQTLFSSELIWFCWHNLLGSGCNTAGIQKKLKTFNPEPLEWFSELEHLITNNSIFWGLVEEVWTYGSHFLDVETVFSRYGRNTVPLEKRQFWLSYKNKLKTPRNGQLIDIKGEGNTPWELMLQNLKRHEQSIEIDGSSEKFLTLFRSFKVKKGNSIRHGITKISLDGYCNASQAEGASWSYSTDPFNASLIGWNISKHHFKKYCGMSDSEASKHMLKKNFVTKEQLLNNPTFGDGFYTALGTYLVAEDDILFFTNSRGENEVVVNPSKVHLLDYHIMTAIDHLACKLCLHIAENNSVQSLTRGNISNLCEYFELMRITVKDLCKKEPTALTQFLKDGFEKIHRDRFFGHFQKLTGFNILKDGCYRVGYIELPEGVIYSFATLLMSRNSKDNITKEHKVPRIAQTLKNACRPKTMRNASWEVVQV